MQPMSTRNLLPSMFLGVIVSVPVGCDGRRDPPPLAVQEEELSPERAREALLEMMRSKPGKESGWFRDEIIDEMAKMTIERGDDGWYSWTGAFRFHPSKAIYTFVVRPKPGVRACAFEYKGS